MGIMFANFHVCGMIFLFNAIVYVLLMYASPRDPTCCRCMMFNLRLELVCVRG